MLKSNFENFRDFTYLDETTWDFAFNMCLNIVGKKTSITFSQWSILLDESLPKFLESDALDKEVLAILLEHVMLVERAYVNVHPDLNSLRDTELAVLLTRNEYKHRTIELLSRFGQIPSPDVNLNYYMLFYSIIIDGIYDVRAISKYLANIAKIYANDNIVYGDILAAYASSLIILGDVKKGVALYDGLLEDDNLNVMQYIKLCDVLYYCEEFETAKKYLNQAIETAYVIDDKDLAGDLINLLNSYESKSTAPHEIIDPDNISLEDLIKEDHADKQKLLLRQIEEKHPEEMEVILFGEDEEEIAKATSHIQKHGGVEIDIVFNNGNLRKEFLELIENKKEHEAIHQLLDL